MAQLLKTANESGAHLLQGSHGLHGGPPRNIVSWIEAETLPDTTADPNAQQGLVCVCRDAKCVKVFCGRPDRVCCYSRNCSICSCFMWYCFSRLCVCVTPTEHKRYRQFQDYRYWQNTTQKKKITDEPKLLSRWSKMTAMPCEKQVYIAVIMTVAVAFPIIPWLVFVLKSSVPLPTDLRLLYNAGVPWAVFATLLWLYLLLLPVFIVLYLFTHYCSCFCVPEVFGWCFKQNNQKRDDFFWVKKEILDKFKKEILDKFNAQKKKKTQKPNPLTKMGNKQLRDSNSATMRS